MSTDTTTCKIDLFFPFSYKYRQNLRLIAIFVVLLWIEVYQAKKYAQDHATTINFKKQMGVMTNLDVKNSHALF